jgi:excisionase family DNA binding protein
LKDKLLTVPQVSKVLGIHLMRVYEMVRSGDIPSLRLSPNRIRVKKSELDAWIEQKSQPIGK